MQRYMRGMSDGGAIQARVGEVLSNEQLEAAVPSIFATQAHESRSERFQPIPTINVLEGLRGEGFLPVFAQQTRVRVESKRNFTRHMLRLRHTSRKIEDGSVNEIILVNANDGTASYKLINGVFRFVCANGLMVGETFGEQVVRHTGDVQSKVIEGAYEVLRDADEVMGAVDEFKRIGLNRDEKMALAETALELRYEEPGKAPIDASRLLTARRHEDDGASLWRTFNTIQENSIRGGQAGVVTGANGRRRRARTRSVNGIDQSNKLNRALWALTERMAAIKSAN